MTIALQPALPDNSPGAPSVEPVRRGRSLRRWLADHPAWPIAAMLAGWPLWFLLGINDYAPVLFAIPMVMRMYKWRATGTRRVRVPPAFLLWVLFLVVTVGGVAELRQQAPQTILSSTLSETFSWGIRTISYIASTIVLLYAGNLTESELPRRRLAWLLGLTGIYTVIGGLAGTLLPNVKLTSPLGYIVPVSIQQSNPTLSLMLHPSMSQVMNFLGYAEGRPSAPFDYTNMWGNSLAILLPWLVVAWWIYGNRRERRICGAVLLAAVVPVVYSLDRGLWVGLGIFVIYLAVRFAARGKMLMLGVIVGVMALVAVVVLLTPLQSLINDRLQHGASNAGRTNKSLIAWDDAVASPLIGWGDTRREQGSGESITVGRSVTCKTCGGTSIGGNGQLQLLLISSGIGGTVLYLSFFGYGIWRYRRDPTPYGIAGVMVLLGGFWFMFVYNAVGPPLTFAMLAYALLWRNEPVWREESRRQREEVNRNSGAGPALPALEAGTGQQVAVQAER
jgi:hypothetical protein